MAFRKEFIGIVLVLLLGLILHTVGSNKLNLNRSARQQNDSLSVAIPLPVQLLLASGDRYLAANINTFRAIMVNFQPDHTTVATQAQLQTSAALFNPAHEDNYYLAAATLSWQDQLPAAQQVLKLAIDHRPSDLYPAFYYGFNLRFFIQDSIGGARAIEEAARRTSGGNQQALLAMAARWYEKASDSQEALHIVRAMKAQSRDPAMRSYLDQRIQRLEGLLILKRAADTYQQKKQKPAQTLNDLIQAGFITQIPVDPSGLGYTIDNQGQAILLFSSAKAL